MISKESLIKQVSRICLTVLSGTLFGCSDVQAQEKDAPGPLVVSNFEGVKVRPLEVKGQKAVVFLFLMHDCPIANSYAPVINTLYRDFERHQVAFYLVYAEPGLSAAVAKRHVKEYGLLCPALLDTTQTLAKRFQATISPEAFVVSPDGKILYQGRIDDRFISFSNKRHQAGVEDLRLALYAVVEERPIAVTRTKAVGCFLPIPTTRNGRL